MRSAFRIVTRIMIFIFCLCFDKVQFNFTQTLSYLHNMITNQLSESALGKKITRVVKKNATLILKTRIAESETATDIAQSIVVMDRPYKK